MGFGNSGRGLQVVLALMGPAIAACGLQTPVPSGGPDSNPELRARAERPPVPAIRRFTGQRRWAFIERLEHPNPDFPDEQARPNGRQRDPEIVTAFGTSRPRSRTVLLHAMPGWERPGRVPVLLVPGAITDAVDAWLSPHGHEGLAPYLAARGHRVFALTFAHRHGDNLLQAEMLALAIARVRTMTGSSRVDVVAHSKGVVAARALVSGVRESWMSPYAGGVRRLVFLGGPLLGIDYTYRHPSVQYGLIPERDDPLANAPLAWERMLVAGIWFDTSARTFMTDHGNPFPGQSQLLYRWDARYPVSPLEPDARTTYHGGQGLVSESRGIDAAIEAGGHFIDRLRQHPLPRGQEVAVLAGDLPTMTTVRNETDGPSDGVVFVASATHTDDLLAGGAKLLAREVLHANHMELLYGDAPRARVAELLEK